jgi:hypothetical protein
MASETCPLCLSAVGRATSFTCPGCKSKYHKDCAADSGECIVPGCKAAAGARNTKTSAVATSNIREKTQSPRISSNRRLAITAVLSILIGGAIGYNVGDASGYDRGYGGGYFDGQSAGYASGKEDGRKEGLTAGFKAGFTEGCESVFERLNYSNVIGYNPGFYYFKYGSVYMPKYQCQ